MTRITPSKFFIMLAVITTALMLAACSPSAEKLNNQGNEAYAEQEYLVALHEYQAAQVESPELAEPYYNAANTLYREGAYMEALEQMQLALQYIEDDTLAENSVYNLGNTFYNTQELDPAVESFISALLLDPDDQDAKYNLELALQQQQQEQQEQESQDQEQSENGEEQQNKESQENQSKNSEEQGEEQNQEDQSQNGENQGQEGAQENESQPGSENEDQQKEADQNQDQGDSGDQPQDSEAQSDQQGQPGVLPPGQRMTEEQARQLLAALAQDMDTLQERLGQILQVQNPPPAQDW